MKTILSSLFAVMLGLSGAGTTGLLAQTDGAAKLEVTLLNYGTGTQDDHWTVAWVATESGTFIKTLRKQGPIFTDTHWRDHCLVWWTAKGANNTLDGYSSATARDYAGTNSPVILTWNGRDAGGTLMPDGNYTFWVQYAENAGQGPYTTSGLLWTKGQTAATTPYPNQGANFSNMRVIWTPAVATVPPTITSAPPPGTGTVGTAYNFTVTATGTPAPTFSVTGGSLPTGLTLSSAGVISGTPTTAGTFTGTITAANGVPPDATQAFSIVISDVAPVNIGSVRTEANSLVLTGTGPANGTYAVLSSSDLSLPSAEWAVVGTGTIDSSGNFSATVPMTAGVSQSFTRLRVP